MKEKKTVRDQAVLPSVTGGCVERKKLQLVVLLDHLPQQQANDIYDYKLTLPKLVPNLLDEEFEFEDPCW